MAELALQEPAENKEEADDLEAMFVEYEKRVKEFESNGIVDRFVVRCFHCVCH